MKLPTVLAVSLAILGTTALSQAAPSTYQVTGPVLEVTDAKVVIQKGKEQWEIARNAATQVTGDLKVGSKITIQYTMSAATIAVKVEKPKKPAATKPAAKLKGDDPANIEIGIKPAPEAKAPKPAKPAKPAKVGKTTTKPAEKAAPPVKKAP